MIFSTHAWKEKKGYLNTCRPQLVFCIQISEEKNTP
jgi:hypothetical protein